MVKRLMDLFAGLDRAHGQYLLGVENDKGKIGGRGITKSTPVTLDLWQKHIDGTQGLGIIPIKDDGTCSWACIDIDDHTINLKKLEAKIIELKIPALVCRSKSGGAHVFSFFATPIEAKTAREHLCTWAAFLGYGGCEVFPKQIKLANKDDVGNWLNMPYFEAENTLRYCLKAGKPIELEEFLDRAESMRIEEKDLHAVSLPEPDGLEGAPPCLTMLTTQGFPTGSRNEGLFNMGVYARLRWPDEWEDKLEAMNHEFMDPPLKSGEVMTIIKSLGRKEYYYRCNDFPLRPVCNKSACLKCRYGVGSDKEGVEVQLGSLTKIDSDPPQWIIELEGLRVQVSTSDLMDQGRFKRIVFERLHIMPKRYKPAEWDRILTDLGENVEIIEAPKDAGPAGQLMELLWEYLEGSNQAKSRDDLVLNKIWKDVDARRIYFRGPAFMRFLDRKHFRDLKSHQINALLRAQADASHGQFQLKNRCIQWWSVAMRDDGVDSIQLPADENKDVPF